MLTRDLTPCFVVLSVRCPACGMSNSVAWGSMDLPPFRQAVAMLADSWNSR